MSASVAASCTSSKRRLWFSFLSGGNLHVTGRDQNQTHFSMCSWHSESIWKSIFSPPSFFSPQCYFALPDCALVLWKTGTISTERFINTRLQQHHEDPRWSIHHEGVSWFLKYFTRKNYSKDSSSHLWVVHNYRVSSYWWRSGMLIGTPTVPL